MADGGHTMNLNFLSRSGPERGFAYNWGKFLTLIFTALFLIFFKPVLSHRRSIDKLVNEIDILLNTPRIVRCGLVAIYTNLFDFFYRKILLVHLSSISN